MANGYNFGNKDLILERKIDDHIKAHNNPHGVTKYHIGLENVDNKSSTEIVENALAKSIEYADGNFLVGEVEVEYPREGIVKINFFKNEIDPEDSRKKHVLVTSAEFAVSGEASEIDRIEFHEATESGEENSLLIYFIGLADALVCPVPDIVGKAWFLHEIDLINQKIINEANLREEADKQIKFGSKTTTKNSDYFYEVEYDDLDYELAKERELQIYPTGACSAIYKKIGDQVYFARSFDWFYDNSCTYKYHIKKGFDPKGNVRYESWGIAGGSIDLTTETVLDKDNPEYRLIPFFALDGYNENGVVCCNNVVHCYYPKGVEIKTTPTISEEYEVSMHSLPRFILDHAESAEQITDYIVEHVSLTCPQNLRDHNYICHFLIADNNKYFLLEVDTDTNTIIKTEQDKMFNFEERNLIQNEDGTVYDPSTLDDTHKPTTVNKIDNFGAGLERWNTAATKTIENADDLWDLIYNDLNYRRTYGCEPSSQEALANNVNWWSEFVGTSDNVTLTVDTPKDTFINYHVHEIAAESFNNRHRGDNTWHSTHTSLYNLTKRTLKVATQSHEIEECIKEYALKNTDAALEEKLNEEISRAISAESELNTKIEAETLRAENAEITLDSKITQEVTDRNAAILAETNRAKGAEEDLAEDISEVVGDLASEVTRAQTVETNLETRIENLEGRGRYLSGWNMITGLPVDNPTELPYEYKSGDYYLISDVPEQGNKYKPSGSQYTGDPSTEVEIDNQVQVGDEYLFDGNNWALIKSTVKRVSFVDIEGNPDDNIALHNRLEELNTNIKNVQTKFILDDATGNITKTLEYNTSRTFTKTNISSLTFNIPDNVIRQGYISEVTFKGFSDVRNKVTINSSLPVIYIRYGIRLNNLELDEKAYNNLIISYDGISLICYIFTIDFAE